MLKNDYQMNINYRKDVDGLRAIAVFPVIFYHANFETFKGGFVGVDIFFVISGFLITNIIFESLIKNKFSIFDFYVRRARRILPLLFVAIFICLILSFIFLSYSEVGSFSKSAISSLLFYSNFYFWKHTPYFSSDVELQPLLHTWSLSIEEQFYIFYPLFFIILFRFSKKFVFYGLLIFFILSLSVCLWTSYNTGGNLNFYLILTRGWELLVGALISVLMFEKKFFTKERILLKETLSLIGILLIFFSIFFFDSKMVYPGFFTLIPTTGTVLLLINNNPNSIVKKFLSNKYLVFLGLLSYSLYIWHQPFFAFSKIYLEDFSFAYKILLIFITILISFFSWKYIEQTFRNKKIINSKKFIKLIISLFIFLLLIFLLNTKVFTSNSNISTEAKLAKLLTNHKAIYSINMDERQFIKNRINYENSNPEILAIGSSRLMQLSKKVINNNLLNLSVSGASIEDQIVISLMAIEKFKPKSVILGADPWLFNKFNGQDRWKSYLEEYNFYLKKIIPFADDGIEVKKKYFNYNFLIPKLILDKIYTFLTVRSVDDNIVNKEINFSKQLINKDGSRTYAKKDITKEIKKTLINYSMNKYKFSEEKYEIYQNFLSYLKKNNNLEIYLFLSPFHPDSYQFTLNEVPQYEEVEKIYNNLAKKYNIKILGSYDAEINFCKNNEFYDSIHPKQDCLKKIVNKIKF